MAVNAIHPVPVNTTPALSFERTQPAYEHLAFDVVRPQILQPLEIRCIDIAGNVLPREHRAVELRDLGIELSDGLDEIGKLLEDDEVGADGFRYAFGRTAVRDEFGARGHVDAVDV